MIIPKFIPTFQQVLKQINGRVNLYLDIKGDPTYQNIHQLYQIINQVVNNPDFNWQINQFYCASFNLQTLSYLISIKHKTFNFHDSKIVFIGEYFNQLHLMIDPETIDFVASCLSNINPKYQKN